jgi:hypothetical protein
VVLGILGVLLSTVRCRENPCGVQYSTSCLTKTELAARLADAGIEAGAEQGAEAGQLACPPDCDYVRTRADLQTVIGFWAATEDRGDSCCYFPMVGICTEGGDNAESHFAGQAACTK